MMKKEEFLTKLRKNLSVLEEGEIQDIVEEYEQHIDMKMKGGLSQEEAIKDFGDLKELTAGILEAYHVKADYNAEKKNIDFDKVKEESRKATEKATSVIGKGAGALGKSAETAGKWGIQQIKKLYNFVKQPFTQLKERFYAGKKKAKGKGFLGRLWLLIIEICSLVWHACLCFVRLLWNLFWLFCGIFAGLGVLGCIFCFGVQAVLLVMGYPVIGMIIATVGGGLISAAVMIFCFTLLRKKSVRKGSGDITKDSDTKDFHAEDLQQEENDWEYPDDGQSQQKQITVNSYQEVVNHA